MYWVQLEKLNSNHYKTIEGTVYTVPFFYLKFTPAHFQKIPLTVTQKNTLQNRFPFEQLLKL